MIASCLQVENNQKYIMKLRAKWDESFAEYNEELRNNSDGLTFDEIAVRIQSSKEPGLY